jgi:hydrogenase maturation protease
VTYRKKNELLMAPDKKNILLICYGNPLREDDGLGPAVARAVEKLNISGVTIEEDFQPNVEDAAAIAEHETVVFVDASLNGKEPFSFTRLEPKIKESFSSHSVEPASLFGLAKELFHASTQAYVLGIRGYSFDMFQEGLTDRALKNMNEALDFLVPALRSGTF